MFFPPMVLLTMPWLLGMVSDLEEISAKADRTFGYNQLFRAMLDVMFS
jgi:hypothetical protein